MWARGGTEIFYRSGQALVRVPVGAGGTFTRGTPAVVLEGGFVNPTQGRQYDVSPSGDRVLRVRRGATGDPPEELVVVQNWYEEIRGRLAN